MKFNIYIIIPLILLIFLTEGVSNNISYYDLNNVNNPYAGLVNMDILEFQKILDMDTKLDEEEKKEIIHIRERILDGETDIGKNVDGEHAWIFDKLKKLAPTESPIVVGMIGEICFFPQFRVREYFWATTYLEISYLGGINISGVNRANVFFDDGLQQELKSLGQIDIGKAVKILEDVIDASDSPYAKYSLGMAYAFGIKLKTDLDRGAKLLQEAADSGYKLADVVIKKLMLNGVVKTESSESELFEDLVALANLGYMDACYQVAKVYEYGWFGIEKNTIKAIDYYLPCSKDYNLGAIRALSNIYDKNNNHEEAYYWSYIEVVLRSQFPGSKSLTYGKQEHLRLFGKLDGGIKLILQDKANIFLGNITN